MDIARLNVRVTIQRRENSSDALGNRRSEWADVMSCHATVSAESGQQQRDEGIDTTDATDIAFTVRWCKAIQNIDNTGWRVLFEGRAFDVTGVDHLGFTHKALKLLCTRSDR